MLSAALRDSQTSMQLRPEAQNSWIERALQKRECINFVPTSKDKTKCGCGRSFEGHDLRNVEGMSKGMSANEQPWLAEKHSELSPTDAYGTIEFQGGAHPNKAQYVRVSHDTQPEVLLELLQTHWGLELPKLIISVHGGIANFELQPKLKRVFRKGLMKAAKTTGAWIVTGGTDTGVMRHVGDALGDSLIQSRSNIVTIGISPWGVVQSRADLIGRDIVTPYHAVTSTKSKYVVLNSNHSYFLLVDNGTVGRYGCEISLRKKLEKCISHKKINTRSSSLGNSTPVVCLVLEGGTNTISTVLECVTDNPPVPVVVCDGSGRAADLIAFTQKYAQDDGTLPESLRDQLILTIEKTFQYPRNQAERVFIELMLCVKKKEHITVFRMGDSNQDIDLAILTALLKSQRINAPDQLSLALSWNRSDIACSHIFVYGQDWPEGALDQAMMDALAFDRVEFVELLLQNGVSMQKWLTIARLEELYNIGIRPTTQKLHNVGNAQKQDLSSTLRYLVRENKKHLPRNYRYTLYDVGQVIEKLMGGAYRASYCRRRFRGIYSTSQNNSTITTELLPVINSLKAFKYPFNELMIWAILTGRMKMAKFMWQHGEEALAKALVSCKLIKSMAHEAAQDDLEIDISEELRACGREFSKLAVELLDYCYKTDEDMTQQLLTYELKNWSNQTCLSLGVCAALRELIAHTCCQMLLTEMWMGALRMRRYSTLKVLLGILFPPSILFLEFKTKEELQLMPMTLEEHNHDLEDSDSDSDSNSMLSQPADITEVVLKKGERTESNKMPNGEIGTEPLIDSMKKNSPLRLRKMFYEFYTAPVTKFWVHSLGYMVFVVMFTYVVLVKTLSIPSAQEIYIIAYVYTMACDKIREVVMSEPKKMSQKLSVHLSEVWNILDILAILIFTFGMVLRFVPGYLYHGRVFFCIDIIFWYIRILDLFCVSKYLGPYVMMIGKMVKDMLYFIVILLVVLVAFGVVRQSITFPNEHAHWSLVKNIFLEPYFMIYGEVYADKIDPDCNDTDNPEFKCVVGRWVVPAVMAIYLLVANILLINLLIAVFNNTFYQVNAISTSVWKFQRYSLVIEYEGKPILPPPFIFLCHLYLIVRYMQWRCRDKEEVYFDNCLKLFLTEEDVEKVHDFEEECMGDYFREKQQLFESSSEERIRLTTERVETMQVRFDDMTQKENSMRLSLQTVDYRLAKLEEISIQSMNALYTMQQQMLSPNYNRVTYSPQRKVTMSDASSQTSLSPQFHSSSSHTSKSTLSEGRLRPFTNYNKNYHRAPFSRSMSIGAACPDSPVVHASSSISHDASLFTHTTPLSYPDPPTPNNIYMSSALYQRRRKALHRHKCQHADDDYSVTNPSTTTPGTSKMKVTFEETADDHGVASTSGATNIKSSQNEDNSGPALQKMATSPPIDIPCWKIGDVSIHSHHNLPDTVPVTSIITPSRSEYTAITDDIDTSCLNFCSPQHSPTTPHHPFLGTDHDLELYTKKELPRREVLKTKSEELKKAEESEQAHMEVVIRKRMRQISLTENDSMVDIARHVIQEIELSDVEDEPLLQYYSDDNGSPPFIKSSLKMVQSEPFLRGKLSEASSTTTNV